MIVQDLGELERITIAGFKPGNQAIEGNNWCNGRVKSKKRC
jgi:hypothetical protein